MTIISKLLKNLLFLILPLLVSGCPFWPDDYEFEYETIITESPANLEGINSQYDDYNSALPYQYYGFGLYFSSNRYQLGQDFDIIYRNLEITYHDKDDVLNVDYPIWWDERKYEDEVTSLINTSSNQLGPLSFFGPGDYSYFFYADDERGDFDITFTHYLKADFDTYRAEELILGPDSLQVINSNKDDLYPSFNEDQSRLFFCSNRDHEHFNIYSIALPGAAGLHAFFTGSEIEEADLEAVLSSDSDDKCPYIFEDVMVFASDREGGQGGFDLYYSIYRNGAWTDPVNFGPAINTEYDEYRPILFNFMDIQTDLMIFSSDRPGGLGGFDLYMVKADSYIQ
jgi:hypothetical protein